MENENNALQFANKISLITGASSGIGRSIAIELAKNGSTVVIHYHNNQQGALETLEMIENAGGKGSIIKADLNQQTEVKQTIQAILEEYSTIDFLVNNAGGYVGEDEWNGSYVAWQETLNRNVLTVLLTSREVCQIFTNTKKGKIVNIGSRLAISGDYEGICYAAAKAAVVNITKSFAKLLAPFGTANCISPGAARSGYWISAPESEKSSLITNLPLARFVEPEEIARAVVFLLSPESDSITGHNLLIDSGYNLK
jgi:3-oxoacyl-[acyl-carrier protein] reductase